MTTDYIFSKRARPFTSGAMYNYLSLTQGRRWTRTEVQYKPLTDLTSSASSHRETVRGSGMYQYFHSTSYTVSRLGQGAWLTSEP